MVIENLEVVHNFDCNLIERDEKHYVNITNVRSAVKCEDDWLKVKSDTAIQFVIKTINHIITTNRKFILAENEPNIRNTLGKITLSLLTPIFNKFAIQDFFQEDCE